MRVSGVSRRALIAATGVALLTGGAVAALMPAGHASQAAACPPSSSTTWTLDPKPTLTIGRRDGPDEYLLAGVRAAWRLHDGSVVIAMYARGFFTLRFYDGSGRLYASAGGWGEGPYEFNSSIYLTKLPGDSILVGNRGNRIAMFGPRGEHVRAGRLPTQAAGLPYGLLGPRHLVIWKPSRVPPGTTAESWVELLVQDVLDGRLDTVASISNGKTTTYRPGELLIGSPFHAGALWTAGPGTLWYGNAGGDTVRGWRPDGGSPSVIDLGVPPRQVTGADRRAWMSFDLRGWPEADRARARAAYRHLEFPDSMPVYTQLIGDALGDLWVLLYEPPYSEDPYRFKVFGPSGRQVGELCVPFQVLGSRLRTDPAAGLIGGTILEIGSDYLLADVPDSLGVERVVLFRLNKG